MADFYSLYQMVKAEQQEGATDFEDLPDELRMELANKVPTEMTHQGLEAIANWLLEKSQSIAAGEDPDDQDPRCQDPLDQIFDEDSSNPEEEDHL